MSPVPLPVNPLPGADVPGSLAEAQQSNNDALAIAVPTGGGAWQAPGAMLNSWTNYMSSLRFMKDPNGFVHIEGEISPGTLTAGTPVFQLPTGHRPPYRRYWIVASNGASGAFEVTSGGVFQVSDNQAATAGLVYNLGGMVFGAN